jgi:hypothetical protein
MFKHKNQNELEVVHERHGSDSEETENEPGDEEEGNGKTVGKIVKTAVKDYL